MHIGIIRSKTQRARLSIGTFTVPLPIMNQDAAFVKLLGKVLQQMYNENTDNFTEQIAYYPSKNKDGYILKLPDSVTKSVINIINMLVKLNAIAPFTIVFSDTIAKESDTEKVIKCIAYLQHMDTKINIKKKWEMNLWETTANNTGKVSCDEIS